MNSRHIHKIILAYTCAICVALTIACNNRSIPNEEKSAKKDSVTVSNKPPEKSIYQLDGTWQTQNNKRITLLDLKGKVQVIAMVFTNCRYACPKITEDIKNIEKDLPQNIKNKVGFTLVSFDIERDTVGKLKKFAEDMGLGNNWTLLHGNEQEVRELSMLLDVNYEKQENGDFNHTSIITILDKNGVIIHRHEGLEMDAGEMTQKIISILN